MNDLRQAVFDLTAVFACLHHYDLLDGKDQQKWLDAMDELQALRKIASTSQD